MIKFSSVNNINKFIRIINYSSSFCKIKHSFYSTKSSTTFKVPAGMIIKGLNFYKDGSDPITKLDNEYPDWLWELLDEEIVEQKNLEDNKFSRKSHRKERREKIKNDNFDRNRRN
nr:11899_t:CDS:2 [Entrophospora candida]CAG8437944.1 12138_t:CDS:2 [Entrophospora candida]